MSVNQKYNYPNDTKIMSEVVRSHFDVKVLVRAYSATNQDEIPLGEVPGVELVEKGRIVQESVLVVDHTQRRAGAGRRLQRVVDPVVLRRARVSSFPYLAPCLDDFALAVPQNRWLNSREQVRQSATDNAGD